MSWHYLQGQEAASWGGVLLGWRTVCAVESDPYARSVLLARQRDGMLGPFPIWDDVRTFDGRPWAGGIDVVSGGFPCTDIAICGKGAGIEGEQSGLWGEMARIIHDVRPRYVFVENSPMLTSRGLGRVLGDLAEMGFDAEWGVLGARDAGAPHKRDRIWILARHPDRDREPTKPVDDEAPGVPRLDVADAQRKRPQGSRAERELAEGGSEEQAGRCGDGEERGVWWVDEPGMGRVVDGVARRVDRLRALGNGQVPAVAAIAWRVLMGRLDGTR